MNEQKLIEQLKKHRIPEPDPLFEEKLKEQFIKEITSSKMKPKWIQNTQRYGSVAAVLFAGIFIYQQHPFQDSMKDQTQHSIARVDQNVSSEKKKASSEMHLMNAPSTDGTKENKIMGGDPSVNEIMKSQGKEKDSLINKPKATDSKRNKVAENKPLIKKPSVDAPLVHSDPSEKKPSLQVPPEKETKAHPPILDEPSGIMGITSVSEEGDQKHPLFIQDGFYQDIASVYRSEDMKTLYFRLNGNPLMLHQAASQIVAVQLFYIPFTKHDFYISFIEQKMVGANPSDTQGTHFLKRVDKEGRIENVKSLPQLGIGSVLELHFYPEEKRETVIIQGQGVKVEGDIKRNEQALLQFFPSNEKK